MSQNKSPLVSIIIPTYNRAHLIEETLKSILLQTYSFWECLIIDDGSTDDSEKIINNYVKMDSRFQYYNRLKVFKKGPSGCRNYGFQLSKGKYINWFDSDDLMMPDKLETEISYLETKAYDFCISQTAFFEHESKIENRVWNKSLFSKDPLNDFILLKIGWSTNAPLWRKTSLIENSLHFNEKLLGPDDYDYHIQALKKGLKPKVIDKIHAKNRVHPDRIENIKNKAYSKSIIVLDLLKNRVKLNLSKECIKKQYESSFYLLKNMYKQKKLYEGMELSRKLFILNKQIFTLGKLTALFLIGVFYKITNKGYSYFNKIN